MEKRKNKGFQVHGDISGRVVLATDVDIQDFSTDGIRFTCSHRALPRSRIDLVSGRGDLKIKVRGVVVRSSLRGGSGSRSRPGPAYEVAAIFDTLSDDHHSIPGKLVLQSEKE